MWLFKFCNDVVRFKDWILRRKRVVPKKIASSKGERAIVAALDKHHINYEMQYELGYYVHVDFGVHHDGKLYLIEYDGRQHFHPVKFFGGRWRYILQRMRDIIEGWECKDRKIPLLRIKYDVPIDDIESMVLNFIKERECPT